MDKMTLTKTRSSLTSLIQTCRAELAQLKKSRALGGCNAQPAVPLTHCGCEVAEALAHAALRPAGYA